MPLTRVDVSPIIHWVSSIPFVNWPQQARLADGLVRPAMVSDPGWYGMGEVTEGVVSKLLPFFPGCRDRQRMLSVVMQGHEIESHVDLQPVEWVTRLHLPLVTNDDAVFVSDGVECHMMVGSVYKVDTTKPHAIINRGKTPRIHFMFDVVRK